MCAQRAILPSGKSATRSRRAAGTVAKTIADKRAAYSVVNPPIPSSTRPESGLSGHDFRLVAKLVRYPR